MLRIFGGRRVLLLDDDPSMQRLVTALLQREGFRVKVVDKGLDAIEILKKKDFDAVLLDLMMPHEGGMTVIRHLRDTNEAMLRRVILLTATPAAVLKSFENDVFAVVRKPFDPPALVDTVRRLTR